MFSRVEYTEDDVRLILEVMHRLGAPWNISQLTREMHKARPTHPYYSYQTFLQRNMFDERNLVHMYEQKYGLSDMDGSSLRKLRRTHAKHDANSAPQPSLLGSEGIETEGSENEMHSAEDGGHSESEEEPMDEADLLAFEAVHRPVSQFTEPQRDLLLGKLVEMLAEHGWHEHDALPEPSSQFWRELTEVYPGVPWNGIFSREKEWLWRAVRERFFRKTTPTSLQEGDTEHSVVIGDGNMDSVDVSEMLQSERPSGAHAQRAPPTETLGPLASTPTARRSTQPATVPRHRTAQTPSRLQHLPQSSPVLPTQAMLLPTAMHTAIHTPESHTHTQTPYSVYAGQRQDHHDAKVIARQHLMEDHSDQGPSPSPTVRRGAVPLYLNEYTPVQDSREVYPFAAPRDVSPQAISSTSLADTTSVGDVSFTDNVQYRRAYLRAKMRFNARVLDMCDEFGFAAPSQLQEFMYAAQGDPEECRARILHVLECLAHEYGLGMGRIMELMVLQHGDMRQVRSILEITRIRNT
ncbi:hypothetical protein MVES1_003827 [Malassezia vespertilionis]|uniref:uncharacterized protein n=1 Tax=Malassezia vespertilionis TaxID=2020962 RepID=UPI0024B19E68|nr:uncharacterized protein MVES1_003827 [Malassezia vespertilionis]WFD08451.1 hypothetical protein MVES1_003827 [Malassezia vespertilionis]